MEHLGDPVVSESLPLGPKTAQGNRQMEAEHEALGEMNLKQNHLVADHEGFHANLPVSCLARDA